MDLSRYAELFLTESREHLSAINHLLLELERTPGASEPLDAIFRAVHTIKGMSATMGYGPVAELTHELESLLDRVRRGESRISAPLLDVSFATADALESAIDLAVAGRIDEIEVTQLLGRLRALASDKPARAKANGKKRRATSDNGEAGMLVRVRLAPDTQLSGVRAYLVVKRAETLGTVHSLSPSIEALQAGDFDRKFSLRLNTHEPAGAVEAALRSVGDVESVSAMSGSEENQTTPPNPDLHVDPVGEALPREALRQQQHIRIELRRLDTLMNLIGELMITRGRLVETAAAAGDLAVTEAVSEASRLISQLQDEIMMSRMVPVHHVFDRFPRLVRDAARSLGKNVEFAMSGKEIELDRSMLDEIGDPIVHLLRNAVDHGFETPAEREAAGKPAFGKLTLSAARERSSVTVRVSDDGRGIDRVRVLAKAREQGFVTDAAKTELTDEELIRMIARPGFSTKDQVTDLSGRGVGIDAVYSRVRALGGSVEIKTAAGQGTTTILRLPITLAIIRALLARVHDEVYAIPLTHVQETVALTPSHLKTVRGQEVLLMRGDVLPLVRMRTLASQPVAQDGTAHVIVLELGERRMGLVVDELSGQQDIVVKHFDAVRGGAALFSGATILSDGSPSLIVDVGSLL
ncbi:MAG: chemotaxis protein CheA [Anaerolineae bacterium]|nr:chemotaxis protein CheA [Gemmatimonadaceae bacterium]